MKESSSEADTRVLRVADSFKGQRHAWVFACDPGGADASLPAIQRLRASSEFDFHIVTRGRAAQIFSANLSTVDVTPKGGASQFVAERNSPSIAVVTVPQRMSTEVELTSTHPELPIVLIEDYYRSSFQYLELAREGRIEAPAAICAMDQMAEALISDTYPHFGDLVEVTGQPAFDALHGEEAVAERVKQRLGTDMRPLVTFMSSFEGPTFVEGFVAAAADALRETAFVFLQHPRDGTSPEEYNQIFHKQGVFPLEVPSDVTNDHIGAASDLIIGRRSTTLLRAIHRRKPTIHLQDPTESDPLPPVISGASASASVQRSGALIQDLLVPNSSILRKLHEAMELHYPLNSGAAERVTNVVQRLARPTNSRGRKPRVQQCRAPHQGLQSPMPSSRRSPRGAL
ncbi:MAG: hypothetical protein HOQ05_12350 [Corynebacteriales bacterium]|nr:hypothetical protein [Mycobacteriales bacterium]